MTTLKDNTHSATVHAASTEVRAEHSDARWADWQRRGAAQDDATKRRALIIASVVGVGILTWLVVTLV
jgi:hypothetical protein